MRVSPADTIRYGLEDFFQFRTVLKMCLTFLNTNLHFLVF